MAERRAAIIQVLESFPGNRHNFLRMRNNKLIFGLEKGAFESFLDGGDLAVAETGSRDLP